MTLFTKTTKFCLVALVLFSLFTPILPLYAAEAECKPIKDPKGNVIGVDLSGCGPIDVTQGIPGILCRIASGIFEIALALAVLSFLVASFFYLTSGGNEQRIAKGKNALTYVVFGVAVAILAWGAAYIIASALSGALPDPRFNPCK